MNRTRFDFLQFAHAQMQMAQQEQAFREEFVQHNKVVDALKEAILIGERNRQALDENLYRVRLSKIIETLRRLNNRDDFSAAFDELVKRLTVLSDIVEVVDGTPIQNAQIVDTQEFLAQLEELAENWRLVDQSLPEVATLNKELEDALQKLRKCENTLRQTVVIQMLVDLWVH